MQYWLSWKPRDHPLYLMRFVAKLWHSFVHMPSVVEKYRSDFTLFSYSQDHGADLEQKYSEALLVFRQNHPRAMAGFAKDYTGRGAGCYSSIHPHLERLKPDAEGRLWNDLVNASVQRICVANSFLFFNATEAIEAARFGTPRGGISIGRATCVLLPGIGKNIRVRSQRLWPRP